MDGFKIENSVLSITVDLDLDVEEPFSKACDQLLEEKGPQLILDLTKVGFVGSAFFGQMFVLNYKAKKSDRSLLVRTSEHLVSIMEILGLPQLMELEVIPDSSPDKPEEKIE